ncbi:MAG TPA: hypothetical protein VN805_01415 [Caulobacteraceae bacterium]|nr:hypothetical protein [Caulobacteraceae bacterium]
MAERNFGGELGRMFAEAPALADADLFALRVDERLSRGWTVRRLVIGGMGVAGGVIGGVQVLGGGLVERLGGAATDAGGQLTGKLADLVADNLMPQSFPLNAEVIWLAATVVAAVVAFAVTRVVREF